jgi:hypothetical protein
MQIDQLKRRDLISLLEVRRISYKAWPTVRNSLPRISVADIVLSDASMSIFSMVYPTSRP